MDWLTGVDPARPCSVTVTVPSEENCSCTGRGKGVTTSAQTASSATRSNGVISALAPATVTSAPSALAQESIQTVVTVAVTVIPTLMVLGSVRAGPENEGAMR